MTRFWLLLPLPNLRRCFGLIIASTLAAVAVGSIELRADGGYVENRTLLGGLLGIVLPLTLSIFVHVLYTSFLTPAYATLARFGASRRRLLLELGVPVLAAGVLLGAWLTCSVALVASARTEELLHAAFVGALGGVGYASWMLLAATFRAKRAAVAVAVGLDWILGFLGVLALACPRGLLRIVAGGTSIAGVSPFAAGALLLLLSGGCIAVALRRTQP